jgi:hypothetical protein
VLPQSRLDPKAVFRFWRQELTPQATVPTADTTIHSDETDPPRAATARAISAVGSIIGMCNNKDRPAQAAASDNQLSPAIIVGAASRITRAKTPVKPPSNGRVHVEFHFTMLYMPHSWPDINRRTL